MTSILAPESDLKSLSKRIRVIADGLRRLPPNHPKLGDLISPLVEEMNAVAAQLRVENSFYKNRVHFFDFRDNV